MSMSRYLLSLGFKTLIVSKYLKVLHIVEKMPMVED